MTITMTSRERGDLAQLMRRREKKAAKSDAVARGAQLMADFEAQMATRYSYDDDEVWRELKSTADCHIAEARAAVRRRCDELGIPRRFQPSLSDTYWFCRGENTIPQRRVELRRVAQTAANASVKTAIAAIERRSLESQTQLLAGGLTTDEARLFLEQMPTALQLMPALQVDAIQLMLEAERVQR
ncbi:hypothetical protein [Polaromonas sp.]|uniref:hypothetical protein n=1 Tax=Polaromonas sp. TaxID=1869339 RepID=UPI00185E6BD5|nr:hypothetical protein [Polaromonas sp.]NMM07412.1 hypothetical protein [Polaromonas sp.]